MDRVLEKAQDLAEAIRSSEAFIQMKQCEQRMQNSEAAVKANAEYDRVFAYARSAVHRDGGEKTQALEMLHRAHAQRDACPEIAEYLAASDQFHQMMQNVNQLLQLIVTERLTDASGTCSGDCSACQGCSR